MQNPYDKFEFQKIREEIAKKCRTEIGSAMAYSLKMLEDEKKLGHELAVLQEALAINSGYGVIPIDGSSDLSSYVILAKKGGALSVEMLERCANDFLNALSIRRFFQKVTNALLLEEYVKSFPDLVFLEKSIHKIIAPDLTIYDNASPTLKSIRLSIKRLESTIKKKLSFVLESNKDFLSDSTLTIKNGHYVLPVKNSYKNKVKGIVQDISNSGETTFIEPELLVEMNNKMLALQNDEREEIHRLLMELSKEVAINGEEITKSNAMIGYIDFISAKALYAEEFNCHVAAIEKEPTIDLLEARHPLIDQTKVVANDFRLSEEKSLVVITGPNAGGKTVALKTLGLAVMMNQCGLAIPAKQGSSLSYFKNIYIDIGDSQSLSDNLSTFSGHMKNIAEILAVVGGKDMVLLDEVGTGTSPKEGEAIALGVVNYLLRKHALAMISSHFEGLKAFALSSERATNASMAFDEERLLPTYRLRMGLPGESYGLIVAKRFGIPDSLIVEAEDYLSNNQNLSVAETIKKLSSLTKEAEEEREKLKEKESELLRKEEDVKSKQASLNLREERFLSEVEIKKKRMLEQYENEVQEIIRTLNKDNLKLHEAVEAKKRIEGLEEEKDLESFDEKLYPGDYVSVPSLFVSGRIVKKKGSRIEIITPEGMTFKTKESLATKIEAPIVRNSEVHSTISLDDLAYSKSVPLELNLIGQRAEEAKSNLERYLDGCLMKHLKRVRIIHGWGSGVLRKVVRDYCDASKQFVDHYESAGENEGGGGATIVYLK